MTIAVLTSDAREHYKQYDRPVPYFGAAPEALLQGFGGLDGATVHVLGCTQQPMNASPEKLDRNIYFHSLHVPKTGWMRTGYQGCIRAIRQRVHEIAPDIVHGQGTERECALSAIFSRRPNVLTIHGNMAELARLFHARPFTYQWLAARLEDFTLPRTAGVFCNSQYTEDLVRPRTRKTWRVPNPLREIFFTAPSDTPRQSPPVIINIGVISPRKRQLEILRLAQKLRSQGAEVLFEFVGDCAGTDEYQLAFLSAITSAERDGYARWLGTMEAAELIRRFDSAAAALHFPVEEAFGLVVAEALTRNLKFFGSRLGGIMDITAGTEAPELFGVDDWEELGAAIRRWLGSGAPRPLTAAEAMRARYHPRVIAERHLQIYREVLNSM
jgi:glycosyltransferase involved in cell wall biosynthesis